MIFCTPSHICKYQTLTCDSHIRYNLISSTSGDLPWFQLIPCWLPGWGNTEAGHLAPLEEGRRQGGPADKVRMIILKILHKFPYTYILIQARSISAYVEVGQGRQLGKHPPGSRLLSSLQGCQGSHRNCSHKKSLKSKMTQNQSLHICP